MNDAWVCVCLWACAHAGGARIARKAEVQDNETMEDYFFWSTGSQLIFKHNRMSENIEHKRIMHMHSAINRNWLKNSNSIQTTTDRTNKNNEINTHTHNQASTESSWKAYSSQTNQRQRNQRTKFLSQIRLVFRSENPNENNELWNIGRLHYFIPILRGTYFDAIFHNNNTFLFVIIFPVNI